MLDGSLFIPNLPVSLLLISISSMLSYISWSVKHQTFESSQIFIMSSYISAGTITYKESLFETSSTSINKNYWKGTRTYNFFTNKRILDHLVKITCYNCDHSAFEMRRKVGKSDSMSPIFHYLQRHVLGETSLPN